VEQHGLHLPVSNGRLLLTVAERNRPMDGIRSSTDKSVKRIVRICCERWRSRVLRGKIDLRREPIELAAVVAQAVETVQPMFDVKGHKLEVSISESLVLDADSVRLVQVVGNLLTNAAKYTEAGGHIRLTARQEGEMAVLSVRDNGIGITSDMLPLLFDVFVQADHSSSKAQGGLGIGLTPVKNLVQMHGGTVEARSDGLGKGSEFVVRLPMASQRSASSGEGPRNDLVRPTKNRRVLVVDDNKDAAASLSLLLRLQGHDVRIAHEGRTALEAAASFQPEVIFLDIGMPGMDGYEVARQIRRQPGLEKVVLAAATGWGQTVDRRRTSAAGFDHHLVKPLEPEALQSVLDSLTSR
jgi:CheY-like chemotaxis protein/two-component sensor histidine kinase